MTESFVSCKNVTLTHFRNYFDYSKDMNLTFQSIKSVCTFPRCFIFFTWYDNLVIGK